MLDYNGHYNTFIKQERAIKIPMASLTPNKPTTITLSLGPDHVVKDPLRGHEKRQNKIANSADLREQRGKNDDGRI